MKNTKEKGAFIIASGPSTQRELKALADVYFDNLSPEGGGLFEIKGIDGKVSTTGGVMNNWLMWIFTAQFVDEMVRRGWIPWFWIGGYTVGGGDYNKAARPFFFKQGF